MIHDPSRNLTSVFGICPILGCLPNTSHGDFFAEHVEDFGSLSEANATCPRCGEASTMQPCPSWGCSSSVVRMNIFLLAMASGKRGTNSNWCIWCSCIICICKILCVKKVLDLGHITMFWMLRLLQLWWRPRADVEDLALQRVLWSAKRCAAHSDSVRRWRSADEWGKVWKILVENNFICRIQSTKASWIHGLSHQQCLFWWSFIDQSFWNMIAVSVDL